MRCFVAVFLLFACEGGAIAASAESITAPSIEASFGYSAPDGCGRDAGPPTSTCFTIEACVPGLLPEGELVMPLLGAITLTYAIENITGLRASPEPFPPRHDLTT